MTAIRFGDLTVAVSTGADDWPALCAFLTLISASAPDATPDLTLRVAAGTRAALVMDEGSRVASLTLPATRLTGPADPCLHIGILQAAARCLALVDDGRRHVLLHGSAMARPDGGGVAVLDGGTGAGKTSLALALAAADGELVVDEFLFATSIANRLTVSGAPQLPWHVRADMAPVLTPDALHKRLQFPEDLSHARVADGNVTVTAIFVPDLGRPPGAVVPVEPRHLRRLLRPAVRDHRAKLLDPRLDHVSLFTSPQQVTTPSGVPLADRHGSSPDRDDWVLSQMADIPTYLVGLGRPDDLAGVARAAVEVLDSETARR
jgi:hypothetical protein